jgi:hypothetical protein
LPDAYDCFVVVPPANAQFDEGLVSDIKTVLVDLAQTYDLDSTLFVGVGRSPAPIMAAMESLEGFDQLNLPLSGFRYSKDGYGDLDAAKQYFLFRHFEKFISIDSDHKNIVLIDFVHSGTSLLAAGKYFQKYLEHKKIAAKASMYGIGREVKQNPVKERFLKEPNTRFIDLGGQSTLVRAMKFSDFDGLAAYSEFFVGDLKMRKPRRKSANYRKLIKVLRPRFNEDHAFLSSIGLEPSGPKKGVVSSFCSGLLRLVRN